MATVVARLLHGVDGPKGMQETGQDEEHHAQNQGGLLPLHPPTNVLPANGFDNRPAPP